MYLNPAQKVLFGLSTAFLLLSGLSIVHSTGDPAKNGSSQQADASTQISTPVSKPRPPVDEVGRLVDQGKQRTYYLHTPPSYRPDRPLPLVLALHGSEQQGKQMADQTGLNQLADREGFIVVYPDGLNEKWNVSGAAAEDNVAFVHRLIARLSQLRSIDAQRVYAVGLSNGGILVQKLACENPQGIAAFATVAASMPVQFKPHCQNQTPISLLMINGTSDTIVPWNGGAPPDVRVGRNLSIPPIPQVVDFWRQHNACAAVPQVQQRSEQRVQVSQYQHCQNGAEVTLMAMKGAGHIWPGGTYGESPFLDATSTVWQFFQRHTLPGSS